MLNVPETVKVLFKRDGVRKNFRVHFPNGELPDITNDNIVQESVKFTESLCSQDVLKFGLTEASVIEFETVGIGNMYGMTIECGIEIDLSSLSAADIAVIAAGTWDGVYTTVGDSDIGYAYFRVPYGTFRIESCPRDQQAMAHRKVQAFGYSPKALNDNPFEAKKRNALNIPNSYNPNMYQLFLEIVGYNMPDTMTREGYTESSVSTSIYNPTSTAQTTFSKSLIVKDSSNVSHTITSSIQWHNGYTEGSGSANSPRKLKADSLYSADLHDISYFTILSNIATALENDPLNISLSNSGYTSWLAMAKDLLTGTNGILHLYPGVTYYPQVQNSGGFTFYQKVDIEQTTSVIYPHVNTYSGTIGQYSVNNIYESFYIPKYFTIHKSPEDGYGDIFDYTIPNESMASFKLYTPSSTVPNLRLAFPQTTSGGITVANVNTTGYSYGGDYSTQDIINGYLELFARFGKVNRNNYFELVRLSNSSPVSVLPGEYSQFWWDEYDVLPIGSIRYSYTDSAMNETIAVYEFGSGSSVYDMTGNQLLKAMNISNPSQIETLFDDNFIPNLSPINFTPIDISMKGLPYLEAGDYLSVIAEDGTTANSFNMKQDVNGIQVLTADIESTSGDIIESGGSA